MVIEGGDLIDLGHGNVHLLGQRHQMPLKQTPISVIELVQMLNEQITPMPGLGLGAYQRTHVTQRRVVRLPALEFALATNALTHVVQAGQRDDCGSECADFGRCVFGCHGFREERVRPHRCRSVAQQTHVFLLMVIDGNFEEKSLFLAAIDTATWRATAL